MCRGPLGLGEERGGGLDHGVFLGGPEGCCLDHGGLWGQFGGGFLMVTVNGLYVSLGGGRLDHGGLVYGRSTSGVGGQGSEKEAIMRGANTVHELT